MPAARVQTTDALFSAEKAANQGAKWVGLTVAEIAAAAGVPEADVR